MMKFWISGIALVLVAAACAAATLRPPLPNDTAAVDWEKHYVPYWLPDLSRATPEEPRLAHYDEARATAFLDRVTLDWARRNKCVSCHTNGAYMMVRPLLDAPMPAGAEAEIRAAMVAFTDQQNTPDNPYAPM